jgi:hypothetical protein
MLKVSSARKYRKLPQHRKLTKFPVRLESFPKSSNMELPVFQKLPTFEALKCVKCNRDIRGPSYQCPRCYGDIDLSKRQEGQDYRICERCFLFKGQSCPVGHSSLKKYYKHCILSGVMDMSRSADLCQCNLGRTDNQPLNRFPIDLSHGHSDDPNTCALLHLRGRLNSARREALKKRISVQRQSQSANAEISNSVQVQSSTQNEDEVLDSSDSGSIHIIDGIIEDRQYKSRLKNLSISGIWSTTSDDIKSEAKGIISSFDSQVDKKINHEFRKPLRKWRQKKSKKLIRTFPLGNIHASLMVGPIIIENGSIE